MATKQSITLIEDDDPTVALTVTTAAAAAYNLSGQRVEIVVKPRANSPVADTLYTLSSVGASPKITVDTPATLGTATADFTDRLADPGVYWYHAYVADTASADTGRHTFAYGPLIIRDV